VAYIPGKRLIEDMDVRLSELERATEEAKSSGRWIAMTNLQRRIRKLDAPLLFTRLLSPVGSPSCANADGVGQRRKGGRRDTSWFHAGSP
jgi:hypothetical protein